MTREQAMAAIQAKLGVGNSTLQSVIVDVLDGLGLIKFDKDERDEGRRFVCGMGKTWAVAPIYGARIGDVIIEDIERAGFKIVRSE